MQNKKNSKNSVFSVREIAILGVMSAMLEAVKIALQAIPNVELVTLLIILFTLYIGKKMIFAVWAFVGVECAVWGIGLWTVMYIYVWGILVLSTLLLQKFDKSQSKYPYVFLSTIFGLSFGAFCSIPYIVLSGVHTAFAWWVAGIPYDILHGISNGILCFFLFNPLNNILKHFDFLKQGKK